MSKQFLGVIAAIILVFVGILAFSGKSGDKTGSNKASKAALSQHVIGKGTDGVTLVEYGDFQCPFCGQYYPILKEVKNEYKDRIKFQFRNFPLVSIHQNAFAGARAGEAASLQGKFWEMHDKLYENQTVWSESSNPVPFFEQYAKQIGLDAAKFKQDFASSRVNDTVNADLAEAERLKLTSTPSFFLNGRQVEVKQSAAAFKKLIDDEIAKKSAAAGSSTPQ